MSNTQDRAAIAAFLIVAAVVIVALIGGVVATTAAWSALAGSLGWPALSVVQIAVLSIIQTIVTTIIGWAIRGAVASLS